VTIFAIVSDAKLSKLLIYGSDEFVARLKL